jgi:DNA repair photolyase
LFPIFYQVHLFRELGLKVDNKKIRGRGAVTNPTGRFEKLQITSDSDSPPDETIRKTQFIRDGSRSIIAYNSSPDIGFDASVNPYRGCEHGCAYCYARPTHEYFGLSPGLDFETKILVKVDAPQLLKKELSSSSWKPQVVAISGVTDPYQPAERRLKITRGCLEVFLKFRNPVAIITKNFLVTRDIDILTKMARWNTVRVFISITTLNKKLAARMEPRTSTPERRLEAIQKLSSAGIPTGVMIGPVIPALTDHELIPIISSAANAGARFAACIVLRLPYAVKSLFEEWLEKNYPNKKEKVLNRIRSTRDGRLNDPNFHKRQIGMGIFAEQIARTFEIACRQAGVNTQKTRLTTENFQRPGDKQMTIDF